MILPVFLGLTAWTLDRAFAEYQQESQRDSLRLQQLLLAKAASWDGRRWLLEGLDEPRLSLPDSGLYAFVLSPGGEVLWHSPSAGQNEEALFTDQVLQDLALRHGLLDPGVGASRFLDCDPGSLHFCHSTRVAWGSSGPESIFLILEDQSRSRSQKGPHDSPA